MKRVPGVWRNVWEMLQPFMWMAVIYLIAASLMYRWFRDGI